MKLKFNPLKPISDIFGKKKRRPNRPQPAPQPAAPQPNPYNPQDWADKFEPDFRKQYIDQNGSVDDLAAKYREQGQKDRAEGRAYADEFYEKYGNQGINPEQKTAMQEAANRDINRNMQQQNRLFLGRQGMNGVRGGVNFAQQNELGRSANDSRLKANNDIRNLDEEMKMRNMAARFGIEQGFAGQGLYNRQSAEDLLNEYRRRIQEQQNTDRFSKMFQM